MNMMSILARVALAASLALIAPLAVAQSANTPQDDVLMRALNDEMARAMAQLRLGDQAAPYFIAYEVAQTRSLGMEARGDALGNIRQNHQRKLNVEVRVGSPQADSSRVVRMGVSTRGNGLAQDGSAALPLEDNYDALRRRIWIATDAAYKRALEDLAARQAAASAREVDEALPDLLPVPALVQHEDQGEALLDPDEAAQRLRAAATVLAAQPELEQSMVWLDAGETQIWYLNSEGTSTWRRQPKATLGMAAATRAVDGEPLLDYRHFLGHQVAGLPDAASLKAYARELGERLTALRHVEALDEFTGPVLFRGEAAGQLLAERFANRLAPLPRHYAADPPMQSFVDQLVEQGAGFARRLGARVLPAGVDVFDDPTLREWQGQPVMSAAGFDSQGVATQRKTLVEDGRLKTLLSSRSPAVTRDVSPGNLRGSFPGVSTLILQSRDGVDDAAMQAEVAALLADADQPFALEVERFADDMIERRLGQTSFTIYLTGAEPALPRPVRINRVWPNGRREPVRGLLLADIGSREFRNLVAIGDTPALVVHGTGLAGARMGLFSQRGVADQLPSYLVPDLLFEELSASEDNRQVRRLPLLPKPSAEH